MHHIEKIILKRDKQKFSELKKYTLPLGSYSITGSGSLGIRGMREIGDVYILVLDDLRDSLTNKYEITDNGHVKKIVFPSGNIEAFWEGSFYDKIKDENTPLVKDIIARADTIWDLPFDSLDDILYFKRKMNREKDLADIKLVETWKIKNQHE